MAYFHCRTRIQTQTRTLIPNTMSTWYYAEHVSTAPTRTLIQIWIQIPFPNSYGVFTLAVSGTRTGTKTETDIM